MPPLKTSSVSGTKPSKVLLWGGMASGRGVDYSWTATVHKDVCIFFGKRSPTKSGIPCDMLKDQYICMTADLLHIIMTILEIGDVMWEFINFKPQKARFNGCRIEGRSPTQPTLNSHFEPPKRRCWHHRVRNVGSWFEAEGTCIPYHIICSVTKGSTWRVELARQIWIDYEPIKLHIFKMAEPQRDIGTSSSDQSADVCISIGWLQAWECSIHMFLSLKFSQEFLHQRKLFRSDLS